jgi:hypothetical protein
MLKSRDTYEIMTPESIGLHRSPDDAGAILTTLLAVLAAHLCWQGSSHGLQPMLLVV